MADQYGNNVDGEIWVPAPNSGGECRASETCGCGAGIEVTAAHENIRVALQEWRNGHRHITASNEHHREGNNFSDTERRSNFLEPDELNSQFRPGPYGRSISLKWQDRA